MIYPFLVLWIVAFWIWAAKRLRPKIQNGSANQNYLVIIVTAISLVGICALALLFVSDKGGLIGSSIGGIGTLVAVLITIKSSTEQQEKNKETLNRPYFSIVNIDAEIKKYTHVENKLYIQELKTSAKYNHLTKAWCILIPATEPREVYGCKVNITVNNVGMGPALDMQAIFNVFGYRMDDQYNTYEGLVTKGTIHSIEIDIPVNSELATLLKPHVSSIVLEYSSLVNMCFRQSIKVKVSEPFALGTAFSDWLIEITTIGPQEILGPNCYKT